MLVVCQEEGLAYRAAEILVDRLARRSEAPVSLAVDLAPGQDGVILFGTRAGSLVAGALAEGVSPPADGFVLQSLNDRTLLVAAADPDDLFAAAGAMLRSGAIEDRTAVNAQQHAPRFPIRPIYFATHFGNWYAHAPLEDIKEYVEDLALDGYNELVTWFDLHHYTSFDDGAADWERLAAVDAIARGVGLRVGRIAIANESFEGQASAEWRATGRLAGTGYETDLCPSIPGARELLLSNRRAFLERVKATTQLDWICLWPYDQGGCNCEKCTPWPRTYLELGADVAKLVDEVLPGTELVVSAWWIGTHVDGEDDAFFAELDKRPAWFRTIMTGTVELRRWLAAGHVVPEQYGVLLFPEISMFDALPWGGRGANPAPRKFVREIQQLGPHLTGAMPYSEGRYEDVNKFVWARLQWDPALTAEQLALGYATQHFGKACAEDGAKLLLTLEEELRDLSRAEEVYGLAQALEDRLPAWAKDSWRWQVVAARATFDGLRARLEAGELTDDERSVALAELRRTYEHLQHVISRHDDRSLWGWIYLPFDEWLTLPFNELRLPTASGDVLVGHTPHD